MSEMQAEYPQVYLGELPGMGLQRRLVWDATRRHGMQTTDIEPCDFCAAPSAGIIEVRTPTGSLWAHWTCGAHYDQVPLATEGEVRTDAG